jgi:hypothetical protein
MAIQSIAYYPGETPLFGGELSATEVPDTGMEEPVTQVEVEGNHSLGFRIISRKETPVRTVHTAYFSRLGGCPIRACSVDLELDPQPSIETVAQAILAEQLEA